MPINSPLPHAGGVLVRLVPVVLLQCLGLQIKISLAVHMAGLAQAKQSGIGIMVVFLPSKQAIRVRFSYPAPASRRMDYKFTGYKTENSVGMIAKL